MKLCKICNLEKDGKHNSYCKSCNSKRVVEWKRNNRERYNEYSKNLAKTEKVRTARQTRRKSNPEPQNKEYKDRWRQENPHNYREYARTRRAKRLENKYEQYSESQVLALYGIKCHICLKEINLAAPRRPGSGDGWEQSLHIDHLIPISKNGPDTLQNVRPSHAICNLRKSSQQIF